MERKRHRNQVLAEWSRIPTRLRRAVRGLDARTLSRSGGSDRLSINETVHHLVEANLIASNIIIAALATDGYDYDWTWVNPDKRWMHRLGYDRRPVGPAITMLRALCAHVTGLIGGERRALMRTVRLNDAAGAPRYVMTVEDILRQEVQHADEHLGEIRSTPRGIRRSAG